MIFARDKGQMCNNMLQFAHFYAWSLDHGVTAVSLRFAYKYQHFALCRWRRHKFCVYLAVKWLCRLRLIPYRRFTGGVGDEAVMRDMERLPLVVVEGWHWFPESFARHAGEVRRAFAFKPAIARAVDTQMREAEPRPGLRLGVHIRRGDYARWHGGRYFYGDEVYARFVRRFVSLHAGERVHVYVATNDPSFSFASFRTLCGVETVFRVRGAAPHDLCALSRCQYIIGPPSTFSLMASLYESASILWMFSPDERVVDDGFSRFEDLYPRVI